MLLLALAGTARGQEAPVRVAYSYKVKWGSRQEFERLFFKNHYPVLQAQMGAGKRIQGVSVYRPTYHGDGRADWTLLVLIEVLARPRLGIDPRRGHAFLAILQFQVHVTSRPWRYPTPPDRDDTIHP